MEIILRIYEGKSLVLNLEDTLSQQRLMEFLSDGGGDREGFPERQHLGKIKSAHRLVVFARLMNELQDELVSCSLPGENLTLIRKRSLIGQLDSSAENGFFLLSDLITRFAERDAEWDNGQSRGWVRERMGARLGLEADQVSPRGHADGPELVRRRSN